MGTRLELQTKFEEFLGSRNVYYQPPETLKIDYPCIIYNRSDILNINADDMHYNNRTCYTVIVVDKTPDNPVISKILEMPYTSYDRYYKSDNLNHDVLRVYY